MKGSGQVNLIEWLAMVYVSYRGSCVSYKSVTDIITTSKMYNITHLIRSSVIGDEYGIGLWQWRTYGVFAYNVVAGMNWRGQSVPAERWERRERKCSPGQINKLGPHLRCSFYTCVAANSKQTWQKSVAPNKYCIILFVMNTV